MRSAIRTAFVASSFLLLLSPLVGHLNDRATQARYDSFTLCYAMREAIETGLYAVSGGSLVISSLCILRIRGVNGRLELSWIICPIFALYAILMPFAVPAMLSAVFIWELYWAIPERGNIDCPLLSDFRMYSSFGGMAGIFLVASLCVLWRHSLKKRMGDSGTFADCCRNCGYSFIGLHGRRCPECGTPIPMEVTQSLSSTKPPGVA